ncbi:hypothetical protein SAMN04487895_10370 [Paenibacillus sophorae]|uniref:HTH cro/C1-type domain-containing protein n=1 Tax=Paenibacillus sophorae TaxID=1333845 RepID=A0A1H8JLA6_9BACL|nr:hypothetical protein [Paenibacillus sophorae]QWU13404.1 hypothetical protein KP014_15495 [Paenibacillus sophorae]SEN81543.1 hypothetical protein SAMN04487895_10370 [Paenibacillus sophorae]
MRYCSSDHFYEQQGALICWIRNELKMSLQNLSDYSGYEQNDINDFELGSSSANDWNTMYDDCIRGIMNYCKENGINFTDILFKLAETRIHDERHI